MSQPKVLFKVRCVICMLEELEDAFAPCCLSRDAFASTHTYGQSEEEECRWRPTALPVHIWHASVAFGQT